MAKLPDFEFGREADDELVAFKDAVRDLFNFGKTQFQLVSTAPTFAGRNGEVTFFRNGTDGRLYVYNGSSWNVVASFTTDAS